MHRAQYAVHVAPACFLSDRVDAFLDAMKAVWLLCSSSKLSVDVLLSVAAGHLPSGC